MNYYKLLTKFGYPSDCYVINKIYPETFKESENSSYESVLKTQRAYPNDWQKVPAGEYFVQEGVMPKYFAIKRVADNPLWKKYIYWLNNTYFSYITGDIDEYYGFDSRVFIDPKLKYFKNNPVELTLEQWDKIINKTTEEKFKLPEKWCVLSQGKDTYEKYLRPYLLKLRYDYPDWDGKDYYYHFSPGEIISGKFIKSGFTEITFEQFIRHVLKEEVMKENDKEIISWKLKEDCKKNSKAAFYICTGYTNDNGIIGNVGSPHDIKKLKDAGVLELWFEPIYKEKTLQFGDYNVTFEKVTSGVRITCNGETGTFNQLDKIYKFATEETRFKFGSANIKSIEYDDGTEWTDDSSDTPVSITIGCTTGTWKEFVTIYEKAKSML